MKADTFKQALEAQLDRKATYSPYAAAKLAEQILQRPMRPQMIYNYCNKGYIAANKHDGKWQIEGEQLGAWLERFAIRNVLEIQL